MIHSQATSIPLRALVFGLTATFSLLASSVRAQAEADTINAVASFSILADMVEVVGGDHVTVTSIVGPDSDAHIYSPSVGDARAVAAADIIFVNGLGFEGWISDIVVAAEASAPVIVATQAITPLIVEGEADPHAWNALVNAKLYAASIASGLSVLAPDRAQAFADNAAAFSAEVDALLADASARFSALPEGRRTIVTGHDAFGYFEAQFGLRFLAPLGVNTEAEPSARELAALIRQIRDEEVVGLFVENITNPDLVNQIADETGLEVGGRLYSDALSERGGPATTYLTMMSHNIIALLQALEPSN